MSITEKTAGSAPAFGDSRNCDRQDAGRDGSVAVKETTGSTKKHTAEILPTPSTSPYSRKSTIRTYA